MQFIKQVAISITFLLLFSRLNGKISYRQRTKGTDHITQTQEEIEGHLLSHWFSAQELDLVLGDSEHMQFHNPGPPSNAEHSAKI